MRRGRRALALLGVALAAPLACGSRGPIDFDIAPGAVSLDAAADQTSVGDAGQDAAGDVSTSRDAPHEATLLDCGQCLTQSCGTEIFTCVQSAPCRTTLQCAVQKCIAAGDTSPTCLFQCGSDPQGAIGALAVLQCVLGKCGECLGLLGGLGGIGGRDGG